MSYILEALKKAEAERQLGSAPTIHAAPALPSAPDGAAGNRKPLLIGLGAGVLLASAAAFVAWRHQAAPAVPAVSTASVAARGAAQLGAPPPETAPALPGAAEPAPVAPPAATLASRAPAREAPPRVSGAARPDAPAAMPAHDAPAHGAAGSAMPTASSADDNVRPLAELPESVQREVPRVAFGGYIYSPNPADRLLLVDKTLRHEGEEVAPGLVLEKLLPKAAVMNYRGYRYRVGY